MATRSYGSVRCRVRHDDALKRYYDLRAPEYDESTYELMRAEPLTRRDLEALEAVVSGFDARRVLDVGSGTGWLSALLPGSVTLVDQSQAMLALALRRNPCARALRADVPPLPFARDSFDLVLCCHLYSHFRTHGERRYFLKECARVAPALVLVEQAPQGPPRESWEIRRLRDGSEHNVFKRYLTACDLAAEIGGSVLVANDSFVAAGRGSIVMHQCARSLPEPSVLEDAPIPE